MASSSLERVIYGCVRHVIYDKLPFLSFSKLKDTGISKGKNYSLNFPLRDGITDESYKSVFEPVSALVAREAA